MWWFHSCSHLCYLLFCTVTQQDCATCTCSGGLCSKGIACCFNPAGNHDLYSGDVMSSCIKGRKTYYSKAPQLILCPWPRVLHVELILLEVLLWTSMDPVVLHLILTSVSGDPADLSTLLQGTAVPLAQRWSVLPLSSPTEMTQGEVEESAWYQCHHCLSDKRPHTWAAHTAEPVGTHTQTHRSCSTTLCLVQTVHLAQSFGVALV